MLITPTIGFHSLIITIRITTLAFLSMILLRPSELVAQLSNLHKITMDNFLVVSIVTWGQHWTATFHQYNRNNQGIHWKTQLSHFP